MKSRATWDNIRTCTMGKNDTAVLSAKHSKTCKKRGWWDFFPPCTTTKTYTLYCPGDYIGNGKQRYTKKKTMPPCKQGTCGNWPYKWEYQESGAANQKNRPNRTQQFHARDYTIQCRDRNHFVYADWPHDGVGGRVIFRCKTG